MRLTLVYLLSTILHVGVLGGVWCLMPSGDFEGAAYPLAAGSGGAGAESLPPGVAGGSPAEAGTIRFVLPRRAIAAEPRWDEVPPLLADRPALPSSNALPVAAPNIDGPEFVTLEQSITAVSKLEPETAELPDEVVSAPPSTLQRAISSSPPIASVMANVSADGDGLGPGTNPGNGGTGGGTHGTNGTGSGGGPAGNSGVEGLPRRMAGNRPPIYPADALAAGIEGRTVLRVLVRTDGTVERLTLHRSSGWRSLDQAAEDAVRDWRFIPARRAGVPVAFEVLVPVRFSIREASAYSQQY